MATWTQKQASIYSGNPVKKVATDGTDIFYWQASAGGGVFFFYDVSANSYTAISDGSSFPAGTSTILGISTGGAGIVVLGGQVYTLRYGNGSTEDWFQVWRWTGTGTTWEKVYSSDSMGFPQAIWGTGSKIIAAGSGESVAGSGVNNTTIYSTNGDDWSQGTFAGGGVIYDAENTDTFMGSDLGIYAIFKYGADPEDFGLYHYDNASNDWELVEDAPGYVHYASGPDYHWREDPTTPNEFQRSTNWSGWVTPTAAEVQPARQINMPYSVGFEPSGITYLVYFWDVDNAQWSATTETISPGGVASSGQVNLFVRLSDDNVFAFVRDNSNNNEIWQRDETLPDPVSGPDYGLTHSSAGIPGAIMVVS
jgi:hypothetical protein